MRERDRYVDVLRAVALVRVVTYHATVWAWLPLAFPSMGVMFALGGGLVASSLDRAGSAGAVLRKRLRRLLPPFWVFGATVLVVMSALGWQLGWQEANGGTGTPLTWHTAWLWVLPLFQPAGSAQGFWWVEPLWYITTYLWFLLLSPVALRLFRRWPLPVLAVPPAGLLLLTAGLVDLPDRVDAVALQLCTYGSCWLLGFAHHDGLLRRLPVAGAVAGGLALMGAGLGYALTHRVDGSWSIDDVPLADLLYCLGAVLVLLRLYPRAVRLARWPAADAVITLINQRAMTIYLWGNFAIFLAPVVLARTPLARFDTAGAGGRALEYAATWLLIGTAVLLVGWVEDVAAGQHPQLLPGRPARRSVAEMPDLLAPRDVVPGPRHRVGEGRRRSAGSGHRRDVPSTQIGEEIGVQPVGQ